MIHGSAAIKISADKLESLLSSIILSVIRCKKADITALSLQSEYNNLASLKSSKLLIKG